MTIEWLTDRPINGRIDLPDTYTKNTVLIKISGAITPEWRRLGYLEIKNVIDGELFTAQIKSVEFGNSQFSAPYEAYKISFVPVERLLEIYPNLSIEIGIINMYVTPENLPSATGEPIYTTVTPPTTLTVFTLVAPRSRRSALIRNTTNRAMVIREGTSASLPALVNADPFISIAAGSSYTVEDWSGEIVALMSAVPAATGRVIIKELPYA